MSLQLSDHKYLIFDVYGTLVDWETGIYNSLRPLLARFPKAAKWSKSETIHAFMSVESDIQAQHPSLPYSDLLAKAYEVLQARLQAAEEQLMDDNPSDLRTTTLEGAPTATTTVSTDVDSSHEPSTSDASSSSSAPHNPHIAFGNSVKTWVPFFDSSQALHDLSKHFHLIVLSNVDHASFAYTHSYLSEGTLPSIEQIERQQPAPPLYSRPSPNPHPRDLWLPLQNPNSSSGSKSNSPFSMILTAQDTGAYKPSLTGFLTAFEAIRSEPDLLLSPSGSGPNTEISVPSLDEIKSKTLVVAQSLTHDHEPAKRLGVSSVWIDRQNATLRPPPPSDGSEFGWKWRFETLGDMARAVGEEIKDRK